MKKIFNILNTKPYVLRVLFIPFLLVSVSSKSFEATYNKQGISKDSLMQWWQTAKFGLFIHWGLYSIPAGVWKGKTDYAEWIRNNAQIPLKVYDKFVYQFDPVKFNANAWVRMAKDAGMKYIIITAKHHDGFCMFNSKYTKFDIASTPYKHDILKELADAAHKAGIKIGFYYSIMDWHNFNYLPRRSWEKNRPTKGADFAKYVQYMKNQLRELLTNYGKISVLWFDGNWESTWNNKYGEEIYKFVKSLQPDIIVNNRVGVPENNNGNSTKAKFIGDYETPEQYIPGKALHNVDWETCMTMNDHWGYNKYDHNWKSAKVLVRDLTDIASKGGNFLLNVGPTSEGLFPKQAVIRLKEIGRWMKVNGQSIYGTKAGPFANLNWGRCTQKEIKNGTRLYLHVFNWPTNGKLIVPGIQNFPINAYLLEDPEKKNLEVSRYEDALEISVPETEPDSINSVVVLDVKGNPDVYNPPNIEAGYNIFLDTLVVKARCGINGIELRYTEDGSIPTVNSSFYNNQIILHKTSNISVRAFEGEKPVSPANSKLFKKVLPEPAVEIKNIRPGMVYKYFEGVWSHIPDFNKVKIFNIGIVQTIKIPKLKREKNFGLEFNGFIKIPKDDVYKFYLDSDDGSRLYMDNKLLIDNDGLHGMTVVSSEIALAKGLHPIKIDYIQKSGGYGLKLLYSSQDISKQEVPGSILYMK